LATGDTKHKQGVSVLHPTMPKTKRATPMS
jgi:hypothetical protein